jgi:hypothetical protein
VGAERGRGAPGARKEKRERPGNSALMMLYDSNS